MHLQDMATYGFHSRFAQQATVAPFSTREVGRIVAQNRGNYRVITPYGERIGELSGKARYAAEGVLDLPAVGDFVAVSCDAQEARAIIHAVYPRATCLSRKIAGNTTEEQVIAANIDTLFLVCGLGRDLNLRRIERYLVMAYQSGSAPVILLSKADVHDDVEVAMATVQAIAPGVPVHAISALTGFGLPDLAPHLGAAETVALIGSSGAGKSTLLNALMGMPVQETGSVRAGDERGRHTTTHRELFVLPTGALLIDTPGMRELQLWDAGDGIDDAFDDVATLSQACRYRDCIHENEPGCAVQTALANGQLSRERFANYAKLQKELAYVARKENQRLRMMEQEKWKKRSLDARRSRQHK